MGITAFLFFAFQLVYDAVNRYYMKRFEDKKMS
jgi:hypothetical protein